jgi:hypothetical protein
MPITVNISAEAARERTFGPLPVGWYEMVVDKIEVAEVKKEDSKYKGRPMFQVTFSVTENSHPKNEDGVSIYAGKQAWANMVLHEDLMGFGTTEFLRAVGVEVVPGELNIPTPEEYDYEGRVLLVRMGAKKDEASLAHKEGRAPQTEPKSYKALGKDEGLAATIPGQRKTALAGRAVTSARRVL